MAIAQPLGQQWVGQQVDLPDRQVVGGPPVRVERFYPVPVSPSPGRGDGEILWLPVVSADRCSCAGNGARAGGSDGPRAGFWLWRSDQVEPGGELVRLGYPAPQADMAVGRMVSRPRPGLLVMRWKRTSGPSGRVPGRSASRSGSTCTPGGASSSCSRMLRQADVTVWSGSRSPARGPPPGAAFLPPTAGCRGSSPTTATAPGLPRRPGRGAS